MTSQRAQAYATALKSLRDLKPTKFTDDQMELFQSVADGLLFTDDVDSGTAALVVAAEDALDTIEAADRLLPCTVQRLKDELGAIGPQVVAVV
jgi:hypothetical protein